MEKDPRTMMHQDDQHWFALLGGEAATGAHPDTVQEAQNLRRTVLAEAATTRAAPATPAGLEHLLQDLHRQKILRPQRSWWQRPRVVSLAAAALLVLVLQPWKLWQAPVGPQSVEKGLHAPQMLYVAEPPTTAQTLQAALQAAGVVVQHLDTGSSQVLLAELPQPVPVAVRDVLQRYGLTVPANGKLAVQILPQRP